MGLFFCFFVYFLNFYIKSANNVGLRAFFVRQIFLFSLLFAHNGAAPLQIIKIGNRELRQKRRNTMANNQNGRRNNDEVTFEIREHIAVLEERNDGWKKEVNIVAWNGGAPKVDIRDWDPSHERMARGITLFEDTAEKLARTLTQRYNETPASQRVTATGGQA